MPTLKETDWPSTSVNLSTQWPICPFPLAVGASRHLTPIPTKSEWVISLDTSNREATSKIMAFLK